MVPLREKQTRKFPKILVVLPCIVCYIIYGKREHDKGSQDMDWHEEVKIRRMHRYERRAAKVDMDRRGREERFYLFVCSIIGGMALWAVLFAGALWATM